MVPTAKWQGAILKLSKRQTVWLQVTLSGISTPQLPKRRANCLAQLSSIWPSYRVKHGELAIVLTSKCERDENFHRQGTTRAAPAWCGVRLSNGKREELKGRIYIPAPPWR